MPNPFVYGEVVPGEAFVDREVELDRLISDLAAGQKVFLISPRRYGKSSLVRQALDGLVRRGALTVDVTVSSYSSYLAFLEGYARALASLETKWDRARSWIADAIQTTRPELRYEPKDTGLGRVSVAFPSVRTRIPATGCPRKRSPSAASDVWRAEASPSSARCAYSSTGRRLVSKT